MTDQEQRIARSTTHFTFTGQPVSEWPRWMVFLNYAYDGSSKIVVHLFEEVVTINLGDTVHRKVDGQMTISRGNILRFPDRVPTLNEALPDPSAIERIENTMTL